MDRTDSSISEQEIDDLWEEASVAENRFSSDISFLAENIDKWADTKGWNEKESEFGTICALFHTEISEAFEEFRKNVPIKDVYFVRDADGIPKPEGIGIELANLLIRVLHYAAHNNLDLFELILLKMCYNEKRPYHHGGKRV